MPAFWTDNQFRDPKRAYRFVVQMTPGGASGTSVTWFVKKVGKPAVNVSESQHTYLNHTFYYPGRVSWNTINMTLVDPVSPDATAIFMKYLQDSGYQPPSDQNTIQTLSKNKATGGLGVVSIQQIDGDGIVIEQWDLNNAWIKSVSLGDLDYESDALSMINLEIRYDWAELTVHGGTDDAASAPGTTFAGAETILGQGGSVGPTGGSS
tara:strand:- start:2852 stop:3475 length:624 start_codon:yes stop_codon:yes gene_type:complete